MAKRNLAFVTYIQMWKQRAGIAYGQMSNPDSPTPGATSHAYLLEDPIDVSFPQIRREKATFRGGGFFFGQMKGMISDIGEITFNSAHLDSAIRAMVNRSKEDTTSVNGWTISGYNENEYELEQIGMSFHIRTQSRDTGTDGQAMWKNIIVPQCTVEVDLPASVSIRGGDNVSAARFTVTPTLGGKMPNGVAFGSNQSFRKNRISIFEVDTLWPLALTTFIQDASATGYTLAYLPKYNTVTGGNTNNSTTVGGTPTAASSISTTTGDVTLAAAGTSGIVDECWYPTEFEEAA